jgi:hypothetical protein
MSAVGIVGIIGIVLTLACFATGVVLTSKANAISKNKLLLAGAVSTGIAVLIFILFISAKPDMVSNDNAT